MPLNGPRSLSNFTIGTFNVRGLSSAIKRDQLSEDLNRLHIDVCCIQETKCPSGCCVPMLLLLAITRYTNNCITVHRLHSDYEALPLRANKHIVQFHSTVFIIIAISTLDTTSGDEVPTNTSCRSPAYEMSLPQFPAFSLSEGNLNLGPRWAKWLSRFNRLMVAMEIADPPRKQALLLHYAGPEIDEIYDTLPIEAAAADGSPIDTYESTANALTRYFTPKTNAAFEIYNFRQAKQEATETIDAFVTRLRKLAKTCNFSNTDGEVTNQIIFACHSQSLRRRALRDDLSLDKLVAAARALELSETQAATVEGRDRHVNAVRPHTPADRGRQRSHGHGRSQSRRPAPSRQLTGDNVKRNTCDNCGYELPHKSKECPARGKSCTSCNKVGHFASVCRSSQQRSSHHTPRDTRHTSTSTSRANVVTTDREPTDDHYVFSNTSNDSTIPTRQVFIEGEQVEVIIDTGASVNVLESSTYFAIPNRPSLQPTHTRVFPYGERSPLPVLGMAKFELAYNNERLQVTFHVVEGKGGNLLGYTAAEKLRILSLAAHVTTTKAGDGENFFVNAYHDLFTGNGKFTDTCVKLHIDETVTPKRQPHRRIPYHIRKDVEIELKRLEDDDIIEKTDGPTPWISPIVVVPKKSGAVRICVDMREANKAVMREKHLMPTLDDLITDLNGATTFSTLDLRNGYHQLELHPSSRYITTFSTHVALYRYKRLMFGINSASEIFQNTVAELLRGLPGCRNISDDIIVYGKTVAEHNTNLTAVLDRLRTNNVRLNREKCKISRKTVTFYGHVFGAHGLRADPAKIASITEAARPANASDVRSLLGMAQYVARFIPKFATIVSPLRELTKQDVNWCWDQRCETAYQALKDALTNTSTMTYFDPNVPSVVLADASPCGLGAILTQNGKVVSYASRALSDVEQRYSQTEREMLAVVWCAEHFHLYLYGESFTICSDHQPLLGIIKSQRPASARIERWRIRLLPYVFELKYRPGKDDKNPADYMSRHPTDDSTETEETNSARRTEETDDSTTKTEETDNSTENYVRYICNAAVPKAMTTDDVKQSTANDQTLQAVINAINTERWDDVLVQSYKRLRDELSVYDGIVLRGTRIIIPTELQSKAVDLAHVGHQGIVKTKRLLREKIWFPAIDSLAERRVRSCLACQATTSTPITPEPIISTPLPAVPWKTLSADFLGPLPTGELLLVVMDDFSRFPEVEIVSSTASTTVIPKLDSIFARQGIPEILKTDNGPPFNGGELTQFANHLGFHHRKVTPLWPCANGEVERFMAPLMKAIRAAHVEQRSWKQELYTFLRQYRATPHCTTGVSPSEALNQRQMRVTLPQLPQQAQTSESDTQLRHRDAANKAKAKAYSDRRRHAKQSDLQVGDTVLVRQPRRNKLSTPYDARPLEIITRSGSMITAQRGDYTITRNATDDYNEFDDTARVPPDAEPANDALRPCLRQPDDIRRSGRARRPPVRFEDYVGPGEL